MMINLESIRNDWRQRGFSCDVWTDPAGQVWSDFVHDSDELLMPLEGDIELQFNGQTLYPAIGEEVLIPAGVCHTVINIGTRTNHWMYGYKVVVETE